MLLLEVFNINQIVFVIIYIVRLYTLSSLSYCAFIIYLELSYLSFTILLQSFGCQMYFQLLVA